MLNAKWKKKNQMVTPGKGKSVNKKTNKAADLNWFNLESKIDLIGSPLKCKISYLHSFLLFACWLFLNLIQKGFSLI